MLSAPLKWASWLRAKCSSPSALSKVAQNVGWLLAGKGVGALLSIVYLGLATRTLGPSGFGQFALILGLAQTVTGVVSFQTWRLVVLYGHDTQARSALQPEQDKGSLSAINDIISFGIRLDILAALAGCVLAALGIGLFSRVMGWSTDLSHTALLFALVMLLSIRSTAIGALRLFDRFQHGAAADAVMPVIRMAGAACAALFAPTVTGFLVAWAASEIAQATAYWLMVKWRTPVRLSILGRKTMRQMLHEHPGMIRFAVLTNIGSTLASVNQNMALLAIGSFAGSAMAGLYRLANQLAQAMMRVADMLNRAIYPELARIHASAGADAAHHLTRRTTTLALAGAAIMIGLIVLVGSFAIALVAGPKFADAYPLLLLLGIAAAIELAGVAFEPMLTASNRTGRILVIRLTATAVMAGTLVALMPRYGAMGAAWATVAGSAVSFALFGASARQKRN